MIAMVFRHLMRRTVTALSNDIISQASGTRVYVIALFHDTVDYTYIGHSFLVFLLLITKIQASRKNFHQGGRQIRQTSRAR